MTQIAVAAPEVRRSPLVDAALEAAVREAGYRVAEER